MPRVTVVSAVAILLSAGWTGASGAQPSCTDPDPGWLFCEGFDSGMFDDAVWQDSVRTAGGSTLQVQSTTVASGTHAARSTSVAGTNSILWASHWFGDHPLLGDGDTLDEVYVSARVRFSDLSAGFRLITLYSFEAWDAFYPEPNTFSPYFVQLGFGSATDPYYPGQLYAVGFQRTDGENLSQLFVPNVSTVQLDTDQWYSITMRVRANDATGFDGIIEVWVDGVKIMQQTGVDFRGTYQDYGWNHLMLTTDVGHSTSQSIFYDDVIISEEFPQEPVPPVDPICGNGVPEGSEACDDGNVSNQDGCLNRCIAASCGDGFVWVGTEACDDSNAIDNDGCTNACERSDPPAPRNEPSQASSGCTLSTGDSAPEANLLALWCMMALCLRQSAGRPIQRS